MKEFESYLIKLGYKPFRRVFKKGEWIYEEVKGKWYYSSLGDLSISFIKEGQREIVIGLHEKDKPPTLISPRLRERDDEVNRLILRLSNYSLLDLINRLK